MIFDNPEVHGGPFGVVCVLRSKFWKGLVEQFNVGRRAEQGSLRQPPALQMHLISTKQDEVSGLQTEGTLGVRD